MKFGKEYASQMVLEWEEAYMNYHHLKTYLKHLHSINQPNGLTRAHTLYRAFSGLIRHNQSTESLESSNRYFNSLETTFLMRMSGDYEQEFFKMLDVEFKKVDGFYRSKVREVIAEAEDLNKQMDALIAFRIRALALEEDVVNYVRDGGGDGGVHFHLDVLDRVKIHKRIETPITAIKELVPNRENQVRFNRDNLKKVERQLKKAFIQFYHKIRLLKGYSFLNILAFSKIMKKYDKVTGGRKSTSYMRMVDNSYVGSSDELTKLMDRVEATFIKHFANSNRRKGMDILRPKSMKQTHTVSFFTGVLSGCCVALILALMTIIRARHLFNKEGHDQYMETMFPLYSLFAFIVLHMAIYGGNIFFWRLYRVNHPFIFGYKQGTEMRYMDVLLLSFGIGVLALACVILNLDMEMDPKTNHYKAITELLPLALVSLLLLVMICPLNVFYRSSRFFMISCLWRCLCAPLYSVAFQDFFLADQLTSQVQAFRSVEFYICYYGWGDFRLRETSCKTNDVYSTFYFIVAVVPYWSRFLQCVRRLWEEKDKMQAYNAGKYLTTIVAICTRTAYALYSGIGWKISAVVSSAIAAIYGTYWDIVIDWGLLCKNSNNAFLRDKLLLPHKTIYIVAMILNVLLRFAWLQTVLGIKVPYFHRETVITIFASLEIVRRGIWNFFRVENEHVNNVGKYRAFKSVPLPFKYYEQEDAEE